MAESESAFLTLLNFRDLGGLSTADGHRTGSGRVYRSESLAIASPADIQVLRSRYNVGVVIDLRSELETQSAPAVWSNRTEVEYLNLPFSDGFDAIDRNMPAADLDTLVSRRYLSYLRTATRNIIGALAAVSAAVSAGTPVLFACTYGKDRTGVLAMLLLGLVNVRRDSIVDDYAATASAMEPLMALFRGDPLHGPRIDEVPGEIYLARRQSAEGFLVGLDELGGAETWARSSGLSAEAVDGLRSGFLEPA